MEIQDFSHHLEGIKAAIKRQLERDPPKKLGNLAVRMFKENFQKESFFGRARKEVKRRLQGAQGAAGQRKILTGPTGNLGRSIQFTPHDGSVTVGSDLPYSSLSCDCALERTIVNLGQAGRIDRRNGSRRPRPLCRDGSRGTTRRRSLRA